MTPRLLTSRTLYKGSPMTILALVPKRRRGALAFRVVEEMVGKGRRKKMRKLAKPSPKLKELHWALKERLEQITGPVRLSPINNLLAHANNRYSYQFDLKDAFPSVSVDRLAARLFVLDS